jgi:hypothetical protein
LPATTCRSPLTSSTSPTTHTHLHSSPAPCWPDIKHSTPLHRKRPRHSLYPFAPSIHRRRLPSHPCLRPPPDLSDTCRRHPLADWQAARPIRPLRLTPPEVRIIEPCQPLYLSFSSARRYLVSSSVPTCIPPPLPNVYMTIHPAADVFRIS